jgi:hypothetical protein
MYYIYIYIYIYIPIWYTCSNVVWKSRASYTLVDTASTVTGLCYLWGARWTCGEEAVFRLVRKRTAKSDCLLLTSTCLSVCLSARPSVGMEQRDYRWTDFLEILYSRFLVNSVENTQGCIILDNIWLKDLRTFCDTYGYQRYRGCPLLPRLPISYLLLLPLLTWQLIIWL